MKQTLSKIGPIFGAFTFLCSSGFLQANPETLDAIRYAEYSDGAAQLQTGTTTFTRDGVTIDLVGVVHIGDSKYYEDLNRKLSSYDVVLYEMVGGPVKTRSKRDVKPEMGTIHVMQRLMQNVIGLEHQMTGIDYDRPNFVHADATQKQFDELMASRNQSMFSLFARAMAMENSKEMQEHMEKIGGQKLAAQMSEAVAELNPAKFKRGMAPMLANSEEFLKEMAGEMGEILIEERNKIVMKKIDEQIVLGKENIAVFYGAGHMPDFKERLVGIGFSEQTTLWDVAWHIEEKNSRIESIDIIGSLFRDGPLLDSLMSLFRALSKGM